MLGALADGPFRIRLVRALVASARTFAPGDRVNLRLTLTPTCRKARDPAVRAAAREAIESLGPGCRQGAWLGQSGRRPQYRHEPGPRKLGGAMAAFPCLRQGTRRGPFAVGTGRVTDYWGRRGGCGGAVEVTTECQLLWTPGTLASGSTRRKSRILV
jgi:hypothetical protein